LGRRFARRTLAEFAGFLAGPFLEGGESRKRGFLGGLDARAKVLGILGLIVMTTFLSTWHALALDAAACAALALAARPPFGRLARVWLAVPLFSALMVLPATVNFFTPGEVLLPLWHSERERFGPWALPQTVGVTGAGLEAASRFVLRCLICVTLVLVLTHTTRPDRLFKGLRTLGVPKIFVFLLATVERYLVVLVRAAQEIHQAKLSRTLAAGSLRREQAWVAAGAGALFRRSRALGNAVYLAMLSRGFTGEARLLEEPRLGPADAAFLALSAASCGLLWAVERWA
jgi:cobalt/nickel transport system permease protein